LSKRSRKRPRKQTAARVEEAPAADVAEPPAWRAPWLLYLAAGVVWFWSFGYTIMRGSDLWWHLASGRWMWEHGAVPSADPWSFTHQGKPWMHHEWLTDVLYHGWAQALGMESLAWWKWTVIIATFLLLMWTLRRLTGSPLAAFASALFALAVAAPFLDVRPHLYSLLGFALLLRMALATPTPSRWLPLLFLVWVNLHGGFFFGLMALFAILGAAALFPSALAPETHASDEAPSARKRRWLLLGALGLACVAICLINPHGIEPFGYPLRYAFSQTSPYRSLGEWHPPFQPGGIQAPLFPWALGTFAFAILGVLASGRWRRDRRELAVGLVLSALTLAMALKSRRFIPLFAMSHTLLLAPALAWAMQRPAARLRAALEPRFGVRWPALLLPTALLFAGLLALGRFPQSNRAFHYLTALDTFPVETCNFVQRNGIAGKVFAYYNWGGYLHLRLDGQLQVYIDGRADTVFDDQTYLRYVRAMTGRSGAAEIIDRSGADFVLWPKNRQALVKTLLKGGRWRPLFEDTVSVLLVHEGSPVPQPLVDTEPSAYRELRLADQALRMRDLNRAAQHLERALELVPHLGAACYRLVKVRASQGETAQADAMLDRCQAIFPDPPRAASIRKGIRARDGAAQAGKAR